MTQSSSEALESEKKGPPPGEPHGDDGHDDHHEDPIHAENPFLQHHFDTPQQQFDAGKLGIWLFLVTEVLFFAGLFCAYAVYRAQHPEIFNYAHYYLDTNLGALNTIVLILSSLTAAWSVRNAQLGQKKKLIVNIVITLACAFTFLCVKYVEYSHKFHDGLLWGKNFDPKHEVWELETFKHKHPEAAALVKKIQAGGSTRANTAQILPPVIPADAKTPGAAEPTAAAAAGNAAPTASAAAQAQPEQPAADRAAGEESAKAEPEAADQPATADQAAEGDQAAAANQPAKDEKPAKAAQTAEASETETTKADEAKAGAGAEQAEPPAAAATQEDPAGMEAAPADKQAAREQRAELAAAPPEKTAAAAPAAATTEPEGEGPDPVLATVAAERAAPVVRGRSQSDLEAAIRPLVDGGMLNEEGTVVQRPRNVHIFFGIYFFMTGLHGIHVLAGIIVWIWLLTRAIKGHFGPRYFGPIDYAALYWHLVDLIWIYLFPLLYLIH